MTGTPTELSITLTEIAKMQAKKSFVHSYLEETPEETLHEEALGIAISQWAQWSGHKIMRVFESALTDANFHTEAALVSSWLGEE